MPDLETLLSRLVSCRVEFVVVGGYAAAAQGCTLVTMDVDICCRMTGGNLLRLQDAVADSHPVHRMTPQRLPLELTGKSVSGLKNLYLDTDLGQLDCLGEIAGIGDYERVLALSEEVELPFGICRILTVEGLIKAKKALDRPRDREAVLQLEALRARPPGCQ